MMNKKHRSIKHIMEVKRHGEWVLYLTADSTKKLWDTFSRVAEKDQDLGSNAIRVRTEVTEHHPYIMINLEDYLNDNC